MVQASQAFHTAVAQNKPQRALFLFDDYVFTNDDVSLTDGVSYEEYFCGETDLTVGLCPSASISFTVLNYNDLLAGFTGGEFTAWLGAETAVSNYQPTTNENCRIEFNNAVYTGHSTSPYFRRNGAAFPSQPGYPVQAIVLFRGFCYLIGENGQTTIHTVGTDISLSPVSDTSTYVAEVPRRILVANAFLLEKAKLLARRGIGAVLNLESRTLTEYQDGAKSTTEYVPMGAMYAERPARVRVKMVAITGYDRMRLFESEISDFTFSGTTLKELYVALAQYINVPYDATWTMNASLSVKKKMPDLKGMTAKELLSKIAEAACAEARFDRNGTLYLDWFAETGLSIDENSYSEYTPLEYTVAPVSKLLVRNSASEGDVIVGEGDNVYFIQENPFLLGNPISSDDEDDESEEDAEDDEEEEDTAAQTATAAGAIYARLAAVPSFSPATCSWFGNPAYRAGDVISVVSNGTSARFPMYRVSLKWTGNTKMDIGNSGGEKREPPPERKRNDYRRNRALNTMGPIGQISKLNEGINSVVQRVNTIEGIQSTYETRISQTEHDITLAAKQTDVDTLTGDFNDMRAEFEVTAAAVTSTVTQVESLGGRMTTAESQIRQTAHDITLKVSEEDITGNKLVGRINLSSTTAQIEAQRVVLSGIYNFFNGTSDASKMRIGELQVGSVGEDDILYTRYSPAHIIMGAIQPNILILSQADSAGYGQDINLAHYHGLVYENGILKIGTVSNTQGSVNIDQILDNAISSNMTVTTLQTQNLKVGVQDTGSTWTYPLFKPVNLSMGSLASSNILAQADSQGNVQNISLQHYHSITATESQSTPGRIEITLGAVASSAQTTNFNIADTAFYQNAVSAATQTERNSWKWYGDASGDSPASNINPTTITGGQITESNGVYTFTSATATMVAHNGTNYASKTAQLTRTVNAQVNVTSQIQSIIEEHGGSGSSGTLSLTETSAFSNTPNLALLFNSGLVINSIGDTWMLTSTASKYFQATNGTNTLYGTASVGMNVTTQIQDILDEYGSQGLSWDDIQVEIPNNGWSQGSYTTPDGGDSYYIPVTTRAVAYDNNENSKISYGAYNVDVTQVYSDAYLAGQSAIDSSGFVPAYSIISRKNPLDGVYYAYITPRIEDRNGNVLKTGAETQNNIQHIYNYGYTAGAAAAGQPLNLSVSGTTLYDKDGMAGGFDSYTVSRRGRQGIVYGKFTLGFNLSNNGTVVRSYTTSYTENSDVSHPASGVCTYIYREGYNDGYADGNIDPETNMSCSITSITSSGFTISSRGVNGVASASIFAEAYAYLGTAQKRATRTHSVDVSQVYRDGFNDAMAGSSGSVITATIDGVTAGSPSYSSSGQYGVVYLPITVSAGAFSGSVRMDSDSATQNVNVSTVYRQGFTDGVNSAATNVYDSYEAEYKTSGWTANGSKTSTNDYVSFTLTVTIYGIKGTTRTQIFKETKTIRSPNGQPNNVINMINIKKLELAKSGSGAILYGNITIEGFGNSRTGRADDDPWYEG